MKSFPRDSPVTYGVGIGFSALILFLLNLVSLYIAIFVRVIDAQPLSFSGMAVLGAVFFMVAFATVLSTIMPPGDEDSVLDLQRIVESVLFPSLIDMAKAIGIVLSFLVFGLVFCIVVGNEPYTDMRAFSGFGFSVGNLIFIAFGVCYFVISLSRSFPLLAIGPRSPTNRIQ